MPPKRGRVSKQSTNSRSNAGAKRSSKPKKSSKPEKKAQNDEEILSAFQLFAIPHDELDDPNEFDDDDDGAGFIKVADVRRCLTALKLPKPPSELFDADQTHLSFPNFLDLAHTLQDMELDEGSDAEPNDAERQEIDHAFALFTHSIKPDSSNDPEPLDPSQRITLADLKRVAKELREDVDESLLRMMLEEANGESGRDAVTKGVGREEFENVMRRAGVFG